MQEVEKSPRLFAKEVLPALKQLNSLRTQATEFPVRDHRTRLPCDEQVCYADSHYFGTKVPPRRLYAASQRFPLYEHGLRT